MIRPLGIDHVVLRTANLDAMVDFYCRVLGCRIERELPEPDGMVQLRAGRSLIDIVAADGTIGRRGGPPPRPKGNNMDHLCLQIEAIEPDALVEYLAGAGVAVGEFADRYGANGYGRSVYIEDPDSNVVELKIDS